VFGGGGSVSGGSLDGIGHGLELKGKNCAVGRALILGVFLVFRVFFSF
jgi:hypothetical protein